MAGKTRKTNIYLFDETTYHKELILNNRENYKLKSEKIGKNTINLVLWFETNVF